MRASFSLLRIAPVYELATGSAAETFLQLAKVALGAWKWFCKLFFKIGVRAGFSPVNAFSQRLCTANSKGPCR
ncbi:hypothetical protein EDD85DRAFT_871503 [Armillaria nabsnona]|nr:hypothetical protein EDD85DRAFT_871503 [Armillaria nabsnona]